MLLRVISSQLRPSILGHRINYHLAADTNLLRRYPAAWALQSSRTLKKVQSSAIDDKKPELFCSEKELLLLQNDPDIFGTFSETKPFSEDDQKDEFEDKDDVAESNYLTNIPFRSQKLRTRQYADMIKKHLKFKRVKEAIDVLEVRMLKEDQVKPQNYIYNLLISECGRLGYTQKAFQLYTRMKQRALKVTGATYTALFNACANSPYPRAALEKANNLRKTMLQNGYVPNETNYNAMIKAFGRCNDIDTAFQLVDEMKDRKALLKVDTFNFLLQACISDKEFGFRHALLVWHKIYQKRLKPDLYTFNLMLKCVEECDIGDLHTMRNVISQILRLNHTRTADKKLKVRDGEEQMLEIVPKTEAKQTEGNEGETNNADDGLATTTDTETGEDQLAPVASTSTSGQAPNLLSKTPHLGSLVALKAVKKPEDRLLLLGGMAGFLEEMEAADVRPDIKTFTKMMDIIPSTKAAEHKLIEMARKSKIHTDVDFFNMLMKKRSMRSDYDGAKEVLGLIEVAKLQPDIVTFGLLALGCKSMHDAQNYLQGLQEEGVKVNIEILGAMLKNASHLKDYDYVLEVLHVCKTRNLKPSPKFLDIVYTFNENAFHRIKSKNWSKHERNEFFRFSREFKNWQKDMHLDGLDKQNAIKAVKENPWKQFKETQPDGEEPAKNTRIQRFSKAKHSIRKLTNTRLENGGAPTPPTVSSGKSSKVNKRAASKPVENTVPNGKVTEDDK